MQILKRTVALACSFALMYSLYALSLERDSLNHRIGRIEQQIEVAHGDDPEDSAIKFLEAKLASARRTLASHNRSCVSIIFVIFLGYTLYVVSLNSNHQSKRKNAQRADASDSDNVAV